MELPVSSTTENSSMIRENGANLWYASTKFTGKPEAARKELCLANLTENYNEPSPKPWYQNRLRRKNVGGEKRGLSELLQCWDGHI